MVMIQVLGECGEKRDTEAPMRLKSKGNALGSGPRKHSLGGCSIGSRAANMEHRNY